MRATGRCGRWVCAWAALALAGGCASTGIEEQPNGAQSPARVEAPEPDALLRGMASRLQEADAFTVEARRQLPAQLIAGANTLEDAQLYVAVKRPDKLYASARSDETTRHFYFDGEQLALYDEARGYYAVVPLSGSIDELIAHLDERFGFVPPLADFVANDPYAMIQEQARSAAYVGAEMVGGVRCEHVTVSGELAEAELWIASDSRLPCQFVATLTELEGRPEIRAEFTSWNLQAELSDEMFEFRPPADAVQIEMMPISEVEGAQR